MPDPIGLISGTQGNLPVRSNTGAAQPPGDGATFRSALEDQIRQVNELQNDAKVAIEDLAAGRRDDVETVMLATLKADTAFRMLLQVRNKVMDAYEEVKQIRI